MSISILIACLFLAGSSVLVAFMEPSGRHTLRTALVAPLPATAAACLLLAFGAIGWRIGTASPSESARMIVPDQIRRILDGAVASGVVFEDEAFVLNAWLNEHLRERERTLVRRTERLQQDLPAADLLKLIAGSPSEPPCEVRMRVYRALAHQHVHEPGVGVYGESGNVPEHEPYSDQLLWTVLRAADGATLAARERTLIEQWANAMAYSLTHLEPTSPLRSGPDSLEGMNVTKPVVEWKESFDGSIPPEPAAPAAPEAPPAAPAA